MGNIWELEMGKKRGNGERGREGERERNTHTHTEREREREREGGVTVYARKSTLFLSLSFSSVRDFSRLSVFPNGELRKRRGDKERERGRFHHEQQH